MIIYKNEWGEEVILYVESIEGRIKVTFSKKNKSDIFCIPNENIEEFVQLIKEEKESMANRGS